MLQFPSEDLISSQCVHLRASKDFDRKTYSGFAIETPYGKVLLSELDSPVVAIAILEHMHKTGRSSDRYYEDLEAIVGGVKSEF